MKNSKDEDVDKWHDHHHDSLWAIFMTWHIVQVLKILSDSAVPFTEDPHDDDDDCIDNNHGIFVLWWVMMMMNMVIDNDDDDDKYDDEGYDHQ